MEQEVIYSSRNYDTLTSTQVGTSHQRKVRYESRSAPQSELRSRGASFTLIELLVVIAILAILAVAVVLILNPVELIKESRDTTRIEDLATINKALSLIQVDQPNASFGSSTTVYVSIPWTTTSTNCSNLGLPTLPAGYAYGCAPTSTYQRADGTGWIPVDFTSFSAGAPFSKLPADPVNATSSGLYYTYIPGGSWEMTALMKSAKRKMGGDKDSTSQDGGQYPELYETGSALNYTPITRDPTLVGYWSFEEGSGNATSTDYSGHGNNGTWYGTSTHYGTGKVGSYAGSFNGSSDYVKNIDFGSEFDDIFSYAVWVNITSGDYAFVLDLRTGSPFQYLLIDRVTPFVRARYSGLSFGSLQWASDIGDGWHHIAATWDGTTARLYVDGAQKISDTDSSNNSGIASTDDLFIGKEHPIHPRGTILMDDVRFYSVALSAAEVQALYNATR